jgi:hypothetical protein
MKARLFICCAMLACSTLHARPRVIESNVRLPVDAIWVGHWGDQLIAIEEGADSSNPGQLLYTYSANLYHRSANGQWVFDHTLAYEASPEHRPGATVVMNATIAAITMANGLRIFERSGGAWTESALDVQPRPNGTPLDLDGTTILATDLADYGECGRRALMLNRAANGHWVESANFPMPADQCVTAVDLDAESAIVRSQTNPIWRPPTVRIFERSGSGWVQAAVLSSDKESTPYYGRVVAIHDVLAMVSDPDLGTHVYRRGPAGWEETDQFLASDSNDGSAESFQITDEYVLRVTGNINRASLVAYLYRQREDQSFEPLAILADDGTGHLEIARVDGNRVFAWRAEGPGQPVEFNLPASFDVPPLVQNDFESNSGPALTPLPGSSFATESNGTTHVYRQSSVAGDAGATLAPDYTNQSISADIRLNAVNGADRWVGLMVRYTNEANFYYVTLRDSNRIVLKRMSGGVFTELASVPIDVSVGQSYRIGLEASGTHLLVCVDGQIVIRGWDPQLTHGRAGLRMYRAAADFDNVVLTPGPLNDLTLAKRETTGAWSGTYAVLTAADGNARLTSGYPRLDAVVQASISVPWSSGVTGRAWAGLMVRHVDAGNYYYVTARQSGQLSLRKLTNGTITVLGTVPFQIVQDQPFLLRLEAIGDKLRVYVNDVLRLERAGASLVPGKVGLATYRTAARFDYYTAYEP